MSVAAATRAGLSATSATDPANRSAFSTVRFHTVKEKPASSSRWAMGKPILPNPRNPNFTAASIVRGRGSIAVRTLTVLETYSYGQLLDGDSVRLYSG